MRSEHISVVIKRDAADVYGFVVQPENLPRWAAGLAQSDVRRDGDVLIADSPMGEASFRFVPRNDLGVLDHDVTLPSGEVVTNPLRVLAHPDGAEVIFTLRQLSLTDAEFDRDAGVVRADLFRLRDLLEA